jgi:hypothetical protein
MLAAWLSVLFALIVPLQNGPATAPPSEAATAPRAAFERFQGLAGTWKGESTRGWKEDVSFRTIAGGSAVVETSFDAHPSETMLTLFAMDGERLRLTHYCVAKNQPRLEATSFADGGKTVTFTFVDGGNLPSRNRGHMDAAVFHFEDADHLTTRWTWYQDGKEQWLEEIRLTRRS